MLDKISQSRSGEDSGQLHTPPVSSVHNCESFADKMSRGVKSSCVVFGAHDPGDLVEK